MNILSVLEPQTFVGIWLVATTPIADGDMLLAEIKSPVLQEGHESLGINTGDFLILTRRHIGTDLTNESKYPIVVVPYTVKGNDPDLIDFIKQSDFDEIFESGSLEEAVGIAELARHP